MKQGEFSFSLEIVFTDHDRLDYLTNVLGYDAATSKKFIASKQKAR